MRSQALTLIVAAALIGPEVGRLGPIEQHAETWFGHMAAAPEQPSPALIRLTGGQAQFFWKQAGRYHRIPNPRLLRAMGFAPRQADSVRAVPGPLGHPLRFFFDPHAAEGFWFAHQTFYPIQSYVPTDWTRWGALLHRIPFPVSRRWVRLGPRGPDPALVQSAVHAISTYVYQNLAVNYPADWRLVPTLAGSDCLQALARSGSGRFSLAIVRLNGRPLQRVIKASTYGRVMANGRGGYNFQIASRRRTTVGVVEAMAGTPSRAFRVSMTVAPDEAEWAWSVVQGWRFLAPGTSRALLSGTSNQLGSPVFAVTVVGPSGAVNTWAELDTGNEGDTLVTAQVARAVGLVAAGRQVSCGANSCAEVPTYRDLSVAPKGTSRWLQWRVAAYQWKGAGRATIDLGAQFLNTATLSLTDHRWVLSWPIF